MGVQSPKAKLAVRLDGHIENIATNIYGEPTSVCGTELRYRHKGALAVNTEKQWFFDFEAKRGGDTFDLILLHQKDDLAAAMASAEAYLSDNPPKPPPRKRDKSQSNNGMAAYASSLIDRSEPSAGTVVENYLKGRDITDPNIIGAVRWLQDARSGEDAMIVISTDETDNPMAIQLTYLTTDCKKSETTPQRKTFNIDPQWAEKGVVRIPGTGTPIVCEGVENALSCAQATGQPAFAVLGVANFGKYVPSGVKSLVVCPDGDHPDKDTHKTIGDAVDQYQLSGITDVRIASIKFDAEKQREIDANDVLREKGVDALKAILDAADPGHLSYKGEVRRLAAMDPDDCAPQVKSVHQAMKDRGIDVPLKDFRGAINRKRAGGEFADFRQEILTSTAQPSDQLRDGGELLTDIVAVIRSLVILEENQALSVALYVMFTHVFDAFEICPRLFLTAATREAGKTRLASVAGIMVERKLSTTNASVASIFRVIETEAPTLVIGEIDSFMKQSEVHRNIINSGHFRDEAYVLRTVGDSHQPAQFSTFAPMILSGIGNLHHTVMSRSIVIRMKRKTKDELIRRLDRGMRKNLREIQSQIARWALEFRPTLENYVPAKPIEALDDRANDNVEPLLVIARLCGPKWEAKARQA
ncbi:MAG: DUF3631 domain-containing protein, partial [Proteobacteria bacterium]|nr:DUF3631 domain-containing protein [Pseudomonadota bacterium]